MVRKICTKCSKRKKLDKFCKNKNTKDGYSYWCEICKKNWRDKNKNKITKHRKKYYENNKIRIKKWHKEWKKSHPWHVSYDHAKTRCTNPDSESYKWYGGRGIKFLMTMEDFKYLWFRDKAYNMKKPSIDKKDNDGNYTLENCRFIEHSENLKRRFRTRRGIIKT